mmetsp:Transcript_43758/g.76139  ORF Transcript_43758/g.76139 Transcript_43758/m.76139 type:complete len:293 (+) Transcript_43758:1765-2643(+)
MGDAQLMQLGQCTEQLVSHVLRACLGDAAVQPIARLVVEQTLDGHVRRDDVEVIRADGEVGQRHQQARQIRRSVLANESHHLNLPSNVLVGAEVNVLLLEERAQMRSSERGIQAFRAEVVIGLAGEPLLCADDSLTVDAFHLAAVVVQMPHDLRRHLRARHCVVRIRREGIRCGGGRKLAVQRGPIHLSVLRRNDQFATQQVDFGLESLAVAIAIHRGLGDLDQILRVAASLGGKNKVTIAFAVRNGVAIRGLLLAPVEGVHAAAHRDRLREVRKATAAGGEVVLAQDQCGL